MTNDDLSVQLDSLKKGSMLSVALTVLGISFLVGAVVYNATRVTPLKEQVAQLDAQSKELGRIVVAADVAAVQAPAIAAGMTGWVYLGRLNAEGAWAPRSERVKSAENPTDVTVGAIIETLKNSSLIDDIEVSPSQASASASVDQSNRMFIKPGTQLKVLALKNQKSINDGSLIWAKVQVASGVFVHAPAN